VRGVRDQVRVQRHESACAFARRIERCAEELAPTSASQTVCSLSLSLARFRPTAKVKNLEAPLDCCRNHLLCTDPHSGLHRGVLNDPESDTP